MIVIGLASVIIGEAVFGAKTIVRATFAVIGGAIIYRIIITLAMRLKFLQLQTGDMKLITALIVIIALVLPKVLDKQKEKRRKQKRLLEIKMSQGNKASGGEYIATVKAD